VPAAVPRSVTTQTLYDASERLSSAPKEADFQLLLTAVNSTNEAKAVSAQLLARYHGLFPECTGQAVSAMVELAKAGDLAVRKNAIRELPKLLPFAMAEVSAFLFSLLGDPDAAIKEWVALSIARAQQSSGEFRAHFLRLLTQQPPESLVEIIGHLRESVVFTAEAVPQLSEIVSPCCRRP
jgi:hypothetical protein